MRLKTAVLLGGTGLVGSRCLETLLEDPRYDCVVTVGRRPIGITHPKLADRVVDFENIERYQDAFLGDDLFYCLGTTHSQAKSREAFRRVEFDYPKRIAEIAAGCGMKKWLMITSVGSSPRSPYFYLRVKGECEREISAMSFQVIHIFRPSFLIGKRPRKRPLEDAVIPLARAMAPFLVGPLRNFRPTEVSDLAKRMVEAAQSDVAGVQIHHG